MFHAIAPQSLKSGNIFQFFGKTVFCGALGGLLALAQPAGAQQSQSTGSIHAVVELFTSQGCASCPPADNLMCNYARDNGIVVLTMPVTCWDYLGWRDTLANEKFTKRQRIYAKMRGERRIYTPQAVINGDMHLLGSDEAAMQKVLASTMSASSAPLPLIVEILQDGENFHIQITSTMTRFADEATILLAPFFREKSVMVEGGENKGRNLTFVNVIRDLVPLAPMPAASEPNNPLTLDLRHDDAMPDQTNGFAILVQSGSITSPGRMLGAAAFVSAKEQ